MIKIVKNKKGMTLMELIVGMLVFFIIAISVTAALPSILGAYTKSNDLAEINTIFNSLTLEMLNDLSDASYVAVSEPTLTIKTNKKTVVYDIGTGDYSGLLLKDGKPVLDISYYKGKTVNLKYYDENGDILSGVAAQAVVVRMILLSGDGEIMATRDYASKPLGLTQY